MTRHRLPTCPATGKIVHPSRAAALGHMRRYLRRLKTDQPMKSFLCKSCGGWHIGRHGAKPAVARRKAKAAA